jgi:hypothetical protein
MSAPLSDRERLARELARWTTGEIGRFVVSATTVECRREADCILSLLGKGKKK